MSISVALVAPLLELVERAGVSAARVRSEAGVDPRVLRDPYGRLSEPEYARVVERVLAHTCDPLLGVHAGELGGPTLSAAGHAAISAPTPRAGLETLFRYQSLLYDGARSHLSEREDMAVVHVGFPRISSPVDRVTSEGAVTRMLRGADAYGDRERFGLRVHFEHAPSAPSHAYERALRCEVRFMQPDTRLEFARAALDHPSRLADRTLFETLARHAERSLERARKESLARDVETVIVRGLLGSHPNTRSVARALSLSPQELKRLMRERGLSFRELLDEARRSLAEQLLLDLDVSVKDAAYRLGFSDPSAFNRAVRRWTGHTPLAYRRMNVDTVLARACLPRPGQSMARSHQVI